MLVRSALYAEHVLCDFRQALGYSQRAVEAFRVLAGGEEDADVAWAVRNVGRMYWKLGQHERALEWEIRALELRQALFPGDSDAVAESLTGVGAAYNELGRL